MERYHTRGKPTGLHYRVVHETLNAANFGVPQKRERVFLVAIRSDLSVEFSFPPQTHSRDALLWQQFGSGEYWEKHRIPRKKRPQPEKGQDLQLQRISDSLLLDCDLPWQTVRDALSDLGPAYKTRQREEPGLTHYHIPGARSYPGHTGSPWDEPAKTLKAGDHGVPGGENTLCEYDGSVRYFTLRESARLQSFPDTYLFPGSWTESMRQVGNAVPVELARAVGLKLRTTLERTSVS